MASIQGNDVRKLVIACDAGMGSSAMGASAFRKKLQDAGRSDLTVTHAAIEAIPEDTDLVVVHENLADRARGARPQVEIVTIENFLGDPALDYAWLLNGPFANWDVDPDLRRRSRFYHRLGPWYEAHYGLFTNQPEHTERGLAGIGDRL